jgi:anti-sigma regulatory factor (Ser/Thr protein kinase)
MDNETKIKKLTLVNQVAQLSELAAFLDDLVDEWMLPPAFAISLNLVLEEAFTNIVFYAFNDENQHFIDLEFEMHGKQLRISLSDDGHEYDPTQKGDPDFDVPLEDRSIGGLGIKKKKKIMDTVEYQRKDNKNYLILSKII